MTALRECFQRDYDRGAISPVFYPDAAPPAGERPHSRLYVEFRFFNSDGSVRDSIRLYPPAAPSADER